MKEQANTCSFFYLVPTNCDIICVKRFLKLARLIPLLIFFNLSLLFSQHFLQKLVIRREK